MRILDTDRERELHAVALYLNPEEAVSLIKQLSALLDDPERPEHFHLYSKEKLRREVSVSIVTPNKINALSYSNIERKLLESN